MLNWDREYRVVAGVPGSEGFEIGAKGESGRALRVHFSCEKTNTMASNSGRLQIWNLNDAHRSILKSKGCVVELSAGYGSVLAPIFVGDVSNPKESLDSADTVIEVDLFDGRLTFEKTVTLAYNGETMCQTVLTDVATAMGIASVTYTPEAQKTLATAKYYLGYSFAGKGRDAISAVCKMCGLKWTLQNGVLQIYASGDAITSKGYVLSASTGLVSIPSKVKISIDGKDYAGYEVEYFLNGSIGVNDLVVLESKNVNGTYWVYKQTYEGDNYNGDWVCKAQLLEVKAK